MSGARNNINAGSDSWSPADEETVRTNWADGKSASEIAKILGNGKTRSAVLGKVHRLKLESRPSPVRAKSTGQKQRKVAPPMAGNANAKRLILGQGPSDLDAPPVPIKGEAFMPLPGSTPVSVLDHKDGCRWPIGDGPILYCNLECEEKPRARSTDPVTRSVYCRTHNHMARSRR